MPPGEFPSHTHISSPLLFLTALGGRGCQPHFTHGKAEFQELAQPIRVGQGKPPLPSGFLILQQGSQPHRSLQRLSDPSSLLPSLVQPAVLTLGWPPGPADSPSVVPKFLFWLCPEAPGILTPSCCLPSLCQGPWGAWLAARCFPVGIFQ